MAAGLKIRKGDTVIVTTGKDKGKKGEVLRALPRKGLVVVQGVNVVKRHQRPAAGNPGGIQEKELPIHVSNLALVDPKSGEPTRVGWKFLDDGRKVRFARKSGEVVDT
ncbi:MAG: 50S ribosomal protein L24 [Alphaproteobacteria bacterium]|nr:50S ribosomal protein L24 [Alphaproteobacteria bacterium]